MPAHPARRSALLRAVPLLAAAAAACLPGALAGRAAAEPPATGSAATVPAATVSAAPATPPGACPAPRVVWLPGGYDLVTRQEPVAAVITERYVRVWETVEEPVFEAVEVPNVVAQKVAVYGLKPVPVYETRKTPVFGDVTVPVYAVRAKPVLGPTVACTGEEKLVPWWHVGEKVQCGVRKERRLLGYRTERVQVGTAPQRVVVGFRYEMTVCGTRTEQRMVRTQTVRRCVGWRTEASETAPAGARSVCERVERTGRFVTLSDAPVRPAPLEGTTEVLTSAQYADALRASRTVR